MESIKVPVKRKSKKFDEHKEKNDYSKEIDMPSFPEELRISKTEIINLITKSVKLGVEKGISEYGIVKKYISQKKAHNDYGESRIRGWVEAGLLQKRCGGNGQNSKILYDKTRCEELDLSETLVIRKAYSHKKKGN